MSAQGCICSASRFQAWDDDGHCATCDRDLSESQIQKRVMGILCDGTGVVLWRNNIGVATYHDKRLDRVIAVARSVVSGIAGIDALRLALEVPYKEAAKVVYGVGNPGGADLIGGWRGRFLAVETKTRRGRQSAEQRQWQQIVEGIIGGVYAMVRSERDARDLLARILAIG